MCIINDDRAVVKNGELTGYSISDIAEFAGTSMLQVLAAINKLKIKSGSRCEEIRLFGVGQVETIVQELKS